MRDHWQDFDPEQPPITIALEWDGGIRIVIPIDEAMDVVGNNAKELAGAERELLLGHFGICLAMLGAYAMTRGKLE